MQDDGDDRRVVDIRTRLEPGEGWGQQEHFIRVIETIGNEGDHLTQFLRAARMLVDPRIGGFDEPTWETILQVAEAVLSAEEHFAQRPPDSSDTPEHQ